MQSPPKLSHAGIEVRSPRGREGRSLLAAAVSDSRVLGCMILSCLVLGMMAGPLALPALAGQGALSEPPENATEIHAVIVRVSWATLRAAPGPKGKAIGIAFGNDAFPVLERTKGWVRVRLRNSRPAWLPEDALEEDTPAQAGSMPGTSVAESSASREPLAGVLMPPEAKGDGGKALRLPPVVTQLPDLQAPERSPEDRALMQAQGLQAAGFRKQAREVYLDIILRYPDTSAFYHAVRGMNFYYPLGDFPEVAGGRTPGDGMALARAKLPELFIREGETCLKENRMLDAAAAFEMALLHGGGMWERATGGLKESLRSFLGAKQQPGGNGAVVLAIGLWRDYFPGEPEPKTAVLAAASTPGSGRPEDVETQATP